MDDGAITEACQGGSVDNGFIDADGAQSRGAERVSGVQDAQLVGDNGSMDLEGTDGAGPQLGAAEEVEEEVDNVPVSKKKKKRGKKSGQQQRLNGDQSQNHLKQRDQAN